MMYTQNQKPHARPVPEDTELPEQAPNPDIVFDLSLISNKESDQKLNPELNLIDCFDSTMCSETTSTDDPKAVTTSHEPRVFSCNYCQRKFYSSQALGGHQNAHKRERTLAKKGVAHKIGTAADNFRLLSHRFSSMASLPLHGSFHNSRSHGIQVHSTIHKPSWNQSSPYGHNGNFLMRHSINPQPAIGRLHLVGSMSPSSSSSGGVGRFDSSPARKFSRVPVAERIGDLWWNSVSHLKTTQDHELQKLDLSLKL